MKRWSLFLAIFIAGLAVLWWIDRGRRKPAPPTPVRTEEPDSNALTEVELGKDKQGKVEAGGPFLDTKFDAAGLAVHRVSARNFSSLGDGVYRFDDLVARFFVPGTDRLRLEVRAKTARGRLRTMPALEFDRDHPVELEDVVATLHEGSPFAPLTLRVPSATGKFADESFSSSERVEIKGTGLSADGLGLSFRGLERVLDLERDTHANLILDDGTPASLSASKGLTFTSLEKLGEGATRVVAKDQAHLAFEGAHPLVVDADVVELDALVSHAKKSVRPTEIRAHGNVKLAPVDGKFFGDEARLELEADGRPRHASLTGSPRVTLLLREVDTSKVPGAQGQPSSDMEVFLSGAGPLEVDLLGDSHFDFLGPATLSVPSLEMTLVAQDKLSGTRKGDSDFGRLEALGSVVAEAAGSRLESNALTVERRLDADGNAAAALSTFGPTHAAGPLPDGGAFDLSAANGLEFVRLPKSFRVPVAHDVDLVVTGPQAFRAKANEVRDLDELTQSFTGVGAVSFENENGRGRGERVIVHGKDSAELLGAPTASAHCEFEQGSLDARRIAIDGNVLRAEGEARAAVALAGATYDLAARWISVERTPLEPVEKLLLRAGGEVVAGVREAQRQLDLTAESLEVRAAAVEGPSRKLESEGLTASGQVAFHVKGVETLDGQGETLTIDADRSGSLLPRAGERVHLSGRLPQNSITFDLSAAGVEFSPEKLGADGPVIEIDGVDVPLGEAGVSSGEAPLRAVAGSMTVDRTSILFTDGVYLGQSATPETAWSLDAEKLVLSGAELLEPGRDEARFTVASLLAWDGFEAAFAEGLRARGSSLFLDREHSNLTLRGDPAQLDIAANAFASRDVPSTEEGAEKAGAFAGHRVSTEWVEFDLSTGFLRAANGSWTPLDPQAGDYEVTFAAMEPAFGLDSRVQVVRELTFIDRDNDQKVRASWALFWLDERRVNDLARRLMPRAEVLPVVPREVAEAGGGARRNALIEKLLAFGFSKWVREAYLEGNIEVIRDGNRRLRADALYVDLTDGHGWVRDLDIIADLPLRAAANRIKLHADWVRVSPDGSGRAEQARLTTCEFDEPHYQITLADVRFKPRPTDRARKAKAAGRQEGADETDGSYDITAKQNRLDFGIWPKIPIPSFPLVMDKSGRVDPESLRILGLGALSFGSSARFGTFVGLTFAVPIGFVSKGISTLLGKSGEKPKDDNAGFVRYLNSRGLLLGIKNDVEEKGVYKMTSWLHFINDTGTDRGLVRVPKDDRDSLRAWLRTEGRRWLGGGEWIDFRLTVQTDPGGAVGVLRRRLPALGGTRDLSALARRPRTRLHARHGGGAARRLSHRGAGAALGWLHPRPGGRGALVGPGPGLQLRHDGRLPDAGGRRCVVRGALPRRLRRAGGPAHRQLPALGDAAPPGRPGRAAGALRRSPRHRLGSGA
jgi:hypothetical protein